MEKKELYDEHFYEVNRKDIVAAEKILPPIIKKLNVKSVVDFGCGSGTWLVAAKKCGCEILGLDGEYIDPEWQLISKEDFKTADLTKLQKLDKKFDLAISLEVAEHIDKKYSDIFIKNIIGAADIILFSAAIPNQEGTDHINEQYPSYWKKKFEDVGYELCDCIRSKYWDDDEIAFWYRQNIMFYVKKELKNDFLKKFEAPNLPVDIVHPVKLKNAYIKIHEIEDSLVKANEKIKIIEDENMKNKKIIEEKDREIQKIKSPKVTIVVPVFNVKNYLRECLDSILNQTLNEIEVLCGDGGSNDGSLEILKEYEAKDSRVKVISRDKSGYGQSVNECMDMAQGEYIGIVESDDKVDPKMYETLYHIAKSNDLDWIKSDIYFYYSELPKEEQLKRENITYGQDIYNVVLNPKYDLRPYKTALRTWSGIYKKDFLDFNHIRHHETPGGSYQDVGFHLKTLYYAKRVYFLDRPFYMWRQDNPGSSIHYDSKKLVEKSVKEWDLNKQYLLSCPGVDKRTWGSFNYRRYFSYLWTIDMAQGEDKKAIRKFAKKELYDAMLNDQVLSEFFSDDEWKEFQKFIK